MTSKKVLELNNREIQMLRFFMEKLKNYDTITYEHSLRVGSICEILALQMNLNERDAKDAYLAGALHDVGKLKIDTRILNKKGRLTKEEFEALKKHSLYGFEAVKGISIINDNVKLAVLEHHESEDGSGYPLGIDTGRIHKLSKIVHIADVYDALISKRSYKEEYTIDNAIREITVGMSNCFDVRVVNALKNSVKF